MSVRNRYKAAIIGLGQIGSTFDEDKKRLGIWSHAGVYGAMDNIISIVGADLDLEKRNKFAKRDKVLKVYKDYKEMLANETIDIVSVCSPTGYHYRMAKEIVKHHPKAIFMEKPITAEVGQAEEIIRLCKRNNIVLAVNHTRRWDSNYILPKQLIEQGRIGEIKSIVGYYTDRIFTVGTHLLDIMSFYAGALDWVVGEYISGEINDPTLAGFMKYTSGASGYIVPQGNKYSSIFEVDILGTRGRLRLLNNGHNYELYIYKESQNYSDYKELCKVKSYKYHKDNNRFVVAVQNIIDCVEGKNVKPACSGVDGLGALAAAVALVASANNNNQPFNL